MNSSHPDAMSIQSCPLNIQTRISSIDRILRNAFESIDHKSHSQSMNQALRKRFKKIKFLSCNLSLFCRFITRKFHYAISISMTRHVEKKDLISLIFINKNIEINSVILDNFENILKISKCYKNLIDMFSEKEFQNLS